MATYLISEDESGTWHGRVHPHNGYYAGDFKDVPMATPRQLAAITALYKPGPARAGRLDVLPR
jgi:hypothetical protein